MKRPTSIRCENCMFYAESSNEGEYICVFNPPLRNEEGKATFVAVKKHWWCGRFKPTDNLTAIEWIAWQKGLEEDAKVQK